MFSDGDERLVSDGSRDNWRIEYLESENESYKHALEEIREIYAGMDGTLLSDDVTHLISYLEDIVGKMYKTAIEGLQQK
jgi:hypothetical protein